MAILNIFRFYSPKQKLLIRYLKTYWGIQPKEISWYEKAVRHKSLIGSGKFTHTDCNERLELLGDAVLDTVITEHLFSLFPEKDEGYLTKIRARIVNRQMLGEVGKQAQLNTVIEARIGTDDSMDKIIGNALEALIGAIYLDRGFEQARKSVKQNLLAKFLDLDQVLQESQDYKSAIIEWAQQHKHKIQFDTTDSVADDQMFECIVLINNEPLASGKERSKKKAEQVASKLAVKQLNL
ncbi:MAG: ribonuclease III [Salibacteraceae bacterium]|nr:ribonuclease III [Salibacteraceae bacterium]